MQPQVQPQMQAPPPPSFASLNPEQGHREQRTPPQADHPLVVHSSAIRGRQAPPRADSAVQHADEHSAPIDIPNRDRTESSSTASVPRARTPTKQNEQHGDSHPGSDTGSQSCSRSGSPEQIFPMDV